MRVSMLKMRSSVIEFGCRMTTIEGESFFFLAAFTLSVSKFPLFTIDKLKREKSVKYIKSYNFLVK